MKIAIYRLCLSFIFLLFVCGSSVIAEQRLKVGVILPLTGGLTEIGSAIRNGIELARADRGELFEKIDFAYEDDQYDGKQTLSAYRRLVTLNKVDLLFSFGSIAGHALTPLVEKQKLLMINIGFEEDFAAQRAQVIRSLNYSEQYVQKLLEYQRGIGVKHLQIINTELSFLNSMVSALKRNLKPDESLEIISTVNPGDLDFRSLIPKLKSRGANSIGLFILPDQLQAFIKQADELRLSVKLYGTDLFETAARLTPLGALDGAVYPYNWVEAQFAERYTDRFKSDAHLPFAGNAYDMALEVAKGVRKAEINSLKGLREHLESIREQKGVLGLFSFRTSPSGAKYFEYPIVLKAIKGSKGVMID